MRSPARTLLPAHEADNAPGHQPRDLHKANVLCAARNDKRVAFIALARFVEIGTQKSAVVIDDALDPASTGLRFYVAVEHAHEN